MTDVTADARLQRRVAAHPYPLLFATVSGAHLYGFPSPDSDIDLRGVHVLPPDEVVGLETGPHTVEQSVTDDGVEVDLVTHDVKKFVELMVRKNGYVLEQLLSPLVVLTTPRHERLKELAAGCVTRHHAHHYLGFARTQWRLFVKENPPRVKPLLYLYRVLLTGLHLMRTGEVEANLPRLNESARLPYIPELIDRKVRGAEKGTLPRADYEFHKRECLRLVAGLEAARDASRLPERPSAHKSLHALLLEVRLPPGAATTGL